MEYEGMEQEGQDYDTEPEENILKEMMQTLLVDSASPLPTDKDLEQFFISFGTVQHESAMEITAQLADRAFLYALDNANLSIILKDIKGVIIPQTTANFTTPKIPES